jgi:hypothetical protein
MLFSASGGLMVVSNLLGSFLDTRGNDEPDRRIGLEAFHIFLAEPTGIL